MYAPPLRPNHEYQTIEDCEAVLQRMASVLAPANADLLDLTATLAALSDNVDDGDTSAEGERRRAEAQIRKAEARYRALVEQIPAVSFLAPLDGSVSELYVSPQIEALLGFSAQEWLSNPILWYSQLHPEDQERWQESFARTLNAGEHFKSDYRFISRAGRIVWVHGEARVVTDDEGRPLFLQGVAFDITESKTAEEKLRMVNTHLAAARDQALEASRAKSAFLANMSHELRTPLNAIVGFSEMLEEDARDGGQDQFLPDLQQIHSSARHLLGMIGGILDLSKIEAGRMDLFLEDFSLTDLIQDVIQSALPLVEENGNCLEVECPDDIGEVHADLTKLRQILFNLLSNAAKFTSNGTITLRAERLPAPEQQFRLDIVDSGIGMTPEQMAGLFQSFSQADVSTTRKYGGTGLGLAISQRFCQMMGGRIEVASKINKGTTFTVIMPSRVTPQSNDLPIDNGHALPAPANDAKDVILVIDDDAQVRDIMSRFLVMEGWQVMTASSAVEGLTLARQVRPAAITLDATLSNAEGWSVLTAIKADPLLTHIPVILVTLSANADQGYTLGATDYLTKPVDWSRLSSMLGRYRAGKTDCRVMVIDDEPANRELLSRMVTREGWKVTEAENGRVALKRVLDAPPDLILLDLMMPEMDGFEVVRLLRKTRVGRSIPVVIVTAKDLTAEDRLQLSGSVERVIQKGTLKKEELLQELRTLVAAAIPAAKAQRQALSEPARTAPQLVTGDAQMELGKLRAERDAALDLTRKSSEWEREKAELLAKQESLAAEAEAAHRQLREQQQSIEFLQAEVEDAGRYVEEIENLKAEIVRLELEQTIDLNQVPTPRDSGAMILAETTAKHRQLTQELEMLRHQSQEYQTELARARSALTQTPSPARKKEKKLRIQSDKKRKTPDDGREKKVQWYISYRDEEGRNHMMTCSAAGIRMWFEKGLLHDATQVLASRSNDGPFNPLSSFKEFKDLVLPAIFLGRRPIPSESDPSISSTRRTSAAENREPLNIFFYLAPIIVCLVSAFFVARYFLTK